MGRHGTVQLKYIHAYRDRHGRRRYYFRRHGKSTSLPGVPGSREFMDAYSACLEECERQPFSRLQPPTHRSLSALAISYFASANYQDFGGKSVDLAPHA
jgi:hypothetical protein